MITSSHRVSLNEHLYRSKMPDDLRHLIVDIARSAKEVQWALRTTEAGLAGTQNSFGEEQVKLDVLSNDIFERGLRESRLAACYISEEVEDVVELKSDAAYTVVFDPLDGSSLVDANYAIGSIFGIFAHRDVIGRTPRDQVAALYVLYGPRTLLVYSAGNGVHEFLLNEIGEFVLMREFLGIGDDAKIYSAGNLAAVADNPGYRKVLDEWLTTKTLRYAGCMVADIHHILSKGQGIFVNIGGDKYPEGKLRMVFECGPFAYLVEQAGGSASDGRVSLLDKPINDLHQRTTIICGSKNEVEKVCAALSAM